MTASFDEQQPWTVKRTVSLRPEPFGALAYDFDTRRLSFLKHPLLVAVVEALAQHPTAADACTAAGVSEGARPAVVRSLSYLAERGMIVQRSA
jgi:putative mycofactocin binding protein MftB